LERKIIGTVCKILEYGGAVIFSNKHVRMLRKESDSKIVSAGSIIPGFHLLRGLPHTAGIHFSKNQIKLLCSRSIRLSLPFLKNNPFFSLYYIPQNFCNEKIVIKKE
jgi:hypothetical protein